MKNFFDVATLEEINSHFSLDGSVLDVADLEYERSRLEKDMDLNLSSLAFLFDARGETEKAQTYINQIQDEDRRLETSMLLYECQIS